MSAVPTAAPNLVQIRRWGLLGKWVKYNENFIYLFIPFFMNSSDPSTDFHDFQTTRTHAGMCLLGVSLTLLPILGVKLLHRFQPHFAQRQRPSSGRRGWSQWSSNKSKMADGRHFEKNVKSLYLCNRLTDFDKIWYSDAYQPLTADRPLKFPIFENPKWRRPPS